MLDALLYAVRDGIRAAGMNYDTASCEIMENGSPPPRCGNYFVAVHGGTDRGSSDNQLQEYLGFLVTLTARVTVPLDRVGDQQMSRNLALVPLAQRQGFYAKREQLRAFLHMNWKMTVLQGQTPNSANDNLAAWATGEVYGFCEPARYRGSEKARLMGSEWFDAEPPKNVRNEKKEMFGIVSEMKFEGARRFQPQVLPVGPFV